MTEALHQNGVFGISHLDVAVTDLERSARFYATALGFMSKASGDGWLDLDASPILLRLVAVPVVERRAALRIQVAQVTPVYRALLDAGALSHYGPLRTGEQEEVAVVRDPDGNTITLWRPLSEDEYGYLPELPVVAQWSPGATALLKSLLVSVPALFRGLARRKIVPLAEELAGARPIVEADVVRAYILSSAKVTRGRLLEPLRRHGIDPRDFQVEFERE